MNFDYGQFSSDGETFTITTPRTPRPWYNMFWNERYVSLFSQLGGGESLAQDRMGNRIEVVKQRRIFLRDQDTGQSWTANALPISEETTDYACTHGLGYSILRMARNDIASSFGVFVPREGMSEMWSLTLANRSDAPRRLSVFPYVDAGLGGLLKPQAYYMAAGSFDSDTGTVMLTTRTPFDDQNVAINFLTSNHPVRSHDTRHAGFIGYGTDQAPDAVYAGRCTGTEVVMEKGVLALETEMTLAPGEQATVHFIVGAATDVEQISELRDHLFRPGGPDMAYIEAQSTILAELGRTRFQLGDAKLNALTNHWLKRQISLGVQWARVRHNGFRDQMQDIGAYAFINHEVATTHLLRVLAFQYVDGHAPRTWLNGEVLDHGFSDNHVWIPSTIHNLVMETGDTAILDRTIPFVDGGSATMYEHARRAMQFLWDDRADNGLCRIHRGDWNDCMNQVGPDGRGVSVWLSQAWVLAGRHFADLSRIFGREEDAALTEDRIDEMIEAIDAHGWDGDHYLRAIDDDGNSIGSDANDEGRCFLNTQTWAVLANIGDRNRQDIAMAAVAARLETDIGAITVERPFSRWRENIGMMCAKLPGANENGGVYLHAGMFKLVAHCLRKEHHRVETAIGQMLPTDHSAFEKDCEPYVFSNSYFALEGYRRGTPGQSWGTGAAGWFYIALCNYILGLKPTLAGLTLDPCLPPSWKHVGVHRRFRGCDYDITFDTTNGYEHIETVMIHGAPIDGVLLPCHKGQAYDVNVIMTATSAQ